MADYVFKLLGGISETSELEIEVEYDLTVAQVKELVRKAFKIAPMLSIDLMAKGKKLSDDSKFGNCDARPLKDTILVIGHRND